MTLSGNALTLIPPELDSTDTALDSQRDALIADKIGGGEWRAHIGQSPSPFVNAATWGLLLTGRLVGTFDETGLSSALTRLIARSGAPIIRASVDTAVANLEAQLKSSIEAPQSKPQP